MACGLQGVGSTINFKPRLANYKSHIKHKRRTCGVVNHFIDVRGSEHSNLKFMLIDNNNEDLRKCENYIYIYIDIDIYIRLEDKLELLHMNFIYVK